MGWVFWLPSDVALSEQESKESALLSLSLGPMDPKRSIVREGEGSVKSRSTAVELSHLISPFLGLEFGHPAVAVGLRRWTMYPVIGIRSSHRVDLAARPVRSRPPWVVYQEYRGQGITEPA